MRDTHSLNNMSDGKVRISKESEQEQNTHRLECQAIDK
jgi:hypothetical protein